MNGPELLAARFCQYCGQPLDNRPYCCPASEQLQKAGQSNDELESTVRRLFPLAEDSKTLADLFRLPDLVILALNTKEAWATLNAIQIALSWKPGLNIGGYAEHVGRRIQANLCPPGSKLENLASRGW